MRHFKGACIDNRGAVIDFQGDITYKMYGLSILLLRIEDGLHSLVLVVKYSRGSILRGLRPSNVGSEIQRHTYLEI